MHPIQLCSTYVLESALGHDVMSLIRGFIMNPLTEIKLKGTISRVKMLANFHKQQLGLDWWETEGLPGVIYIILCGNTRLSTENT